MSDSSNSSLNNSPSGLRAGELSELPDWSGHLPHKTKMSNDELREYCRANLHKIYSRPGYAERRRTQHGISVEFTL